MWKLLDSLSLWSDKLCRVLIALMMTAMVLDVLLGVTNRFVLKLSISWTEQLARFLLIWISMLGAATAVRLGSHIGVTFILARMGRWRRPFLLLNIVLIIGFLSVVGWYGVKLCISQSRQFSPVLQVSMFWPFLAVPSGCFLMILHYGAALIKPESVFEIAPGSGEGSA